MNDQLITLKQSVANLEKDFEMNKDIEGSPNSMKENALELLNSLKQGQDNPVNFDLNDTYEDLIFRVITVVGQLH